MFISDQKKHGFNFQAFLVKMKGYIHNKEGEAEEGVHVTLFFS